MEDTPYRKEEERKGKEKDEEWWQRRRTIERMLERNQIGRLVKLEMLRVSDPSDNWEFMERENPWTWKLVQRCVSKAEVKRLHQVKPLRKLSF